MITSFHFQGLISTSLPWLACSQAIGSWSHHRTTEQWSCGTCVPASSSATSWSWVPVDLAEWSGALGLRRPNSSVLLALATAPRKPSSLSWTLTCQALAVSVMNSIDWTDASCVATLICTPLGIVKLFTCVGRATSCEYVIKMHFHSLRKCL